MVKDPANKLAIARSLNQRGYRVGIGLGNHLVVDLPESGLGALRRHFPPIDNFPGVRVASPRFPIKIEEYSHRPVDRRLMYSPSDYSSTNQWYLDQIDAPEAWDNPSMRVASKWMAIIDTGVYKDGSGNDHPDFDLIGNGKDATPTYTDLFGVHYSYDNSYEDGHGHGTQVAGIAAATSNNDTTSIASASYKGLFRSIAVNETRPSGTTMYSDNVRAGGIWAIDNGGAKVLNLSLGSASANGDFEYLVDYAQDNNVAIVACTGNDSASSIWYPARYAGSYWNVIAVGGTDSTDTRVSASNYGDSICVVAPSLGIKTTHNDGGYTVVATGTSFAAPQVTGVLATVWYACPAIPLSELISVLYATADNTSSDGNSYSGGAWNQYTGYGRLNANDFIDYLDESGMVYFWYNATDLSALYTTDPAESPLGKTYSGIKFQGNPTALSGTSRLRRYYSSTTGDYILSTSSVSGYTFQGYQNAYVATSSGVSGFATGVTELTKSGGGKTSHRYETDSTTISGLVGSGWTSNGVVFYALN